MKAKHNNTRRVLRSTLAVAAALAASAGLGSCIGLDAALDSGGVYWSIDDYIGAPGYYGPGWGAPAPPPPAFAPFPGYYPPVGPPVPVRPVRPPQPDSPGSVRPSNPGNTGNSHGPGGEIRPGNSGRPVRPQGSTTRPR
ncbi:MAG: hypothetical protein K2L96_04985 [Muribaculaceae bacterium]|nr:hypothetical protein [Muribaculaceae bacterium]